MKNYVCFLLFLGISLSNQAQNVGAYQVYNSKGKKVKEKKMLAELKKYDYVFFGEYHDNPIAHWLQYEALKALYKEHGTELMLSFEMFERDQQFLLNSYLADEIEVEKFEDSCRLWPNYHTDYKPLIDFAKDSALKVVASNVPRRYANLLYKRGRLAIDSLSADEKEWMAPYDFTVDTTLSQYASLLDMGQHMGGGNLMLAQAFKDATMAKFTFLDKPKGGKVIHFNGAFHTDYHQGIIWYIQQVDPEASIISISTVTQGSVKKLDKENKGRADFIICVDEDMTSTH